MSLTSWESQLCYFQLQYLFQCLLSSGPESPHLRVVNKDLYISCQEELNEFAYKFDLTYLT